jgi:hypothetical protein
VDRYLRLPRVVRELTSGPSQADAHHLQRQRRRVPAHLFGIVPKERNPMNESIQPFPWAGKPASGKSRRKPAPEYAWPPPRQLLPDNDGFELSGVVLLVVFLQSMLIGLLLLAF